MAAFEQAIETAIANDEIPGCVLYATNRDGTFTYAKALGISSMKPPTESRSPLSKDAIMWVASCSKLMTAICCMQLVEKNIISLDEPVYTHIPELKPFKILKGFNEDGSPMEEPHQEPITLRRLLTHTSGLSYDVMHPGLMQWLKYHGKDNSKESDLLLRFSSPLVFEPGTSWMYGTGNDYAGLLIERVTKLSLEEYMKKNLWEPLGINDITFFLAQRPDLQERRMAMSTRDPSSPKATHATASDLSSYREIGTLPIRDCLGGQGAFAPASAYIKILHALLVSDTDEKLLQKESVEELFRPQLSEGGKAGLAAMMQIEAAKNAMGGPEEGAEKDHALGGIVIMGDEEGGRRGGTMVWGGLPNLTWFVDRKAGLCGLFATQVIPPGDGKCAELTRAFEKGVYELYEKSGGEVPALGELT
ncbi:beta-lactamase/transpeptidase-like protein [Lentithecium fluviatile CBS 122367]|uniref:Beta-lactamase/transpeptidase-like protein n=1 Tax=Lentithecium fluviatile CBS 122367 TaxID=1168545 RepID=A0A6G1IF88_9PLEO|nr:beta-lactamase/transpeptidase-like protein [Lentithecium fluviatile CBS 122367]